MSKITINAIEIASELAHKDLINIMESETGIQEENDLYQDDRNGDLRYKEDVQDVFNQIYDDYFEILTNGAENLAIENNLALRYNDNKPKWSLVPQSSLIPMVRVLEYGATKYAPHNWQKGLPITEICESLKRHLDDFMEGEDDDKESGQSHIGHIQCNALFLSWMMKYKPTLDDRQKNV